MQIHDGQDLDRFIHFTILNEVETTAKDVSSWREFRERVLEEGGIISKYYPDPKDRQEFSYSETYQKINKIGFDVINRFGLR